jgi:thiamine biosynthesis lipoprotein
MEAEARFRAMGSEAHVVVVGGAPALVDLARDVLEDLELRWSRFRPESEVSHVNAGAGSPVAVSAPTLGLFARALDGVAITGGRYDPTVLGAVERAGYDRTFELVASDPRAGSSSLSRGAGAIVIDPAGSTVTLPRSVGFDPGGIGKGYAADLVVRELRAAGADGVCVNVGGDLRVEGQAPAGGAWVVALEHPFRRRSMLVRLRSGAVATSTRLRRTWGPPEAGRHHLIDPETGEPARTGLASVTVLAAEGWQAEILTKGVFVAGLAEGLYLLASAGADGVLVDDGGAAYPSAGLDRFTGEASRGDRAAGASVAR